MGGEILLPQTPPDVAAALTTLSETTDVATTIDTFSPPQPGYRALKAKLAELRGAKGEEPKVVRIPEGPTLRPGMEDSRVPLLRQRLNVAGDAISLRYDEALATAVKAYQKSNRMNPDGMIGAATVRSLNAVAAPARSDVIETVISNMERWRWVPRDLGSAHVMLNIPNYTLRVMHDGKEVWQTRVVVGKPTTATPLLTETMKFITVNPTWNVPPSIVQNEYLPALAQDPTVLARMGLRVTTNRDGSVHISQPPGEKNALGRIRFNFPNRFLVYQHDTPDKHLFAHDKRAYSHGCMRVQDPDEIRRGAAVDRAAERRLHRAAHPLDVRNGRAEHQLPGADSGAHHLPDRLRRCRGRAAGAPRHLQYRRQDPEPDPQRARRGRAGAGAWPGDGEHDATQTRASEGRAAAAHGRLLRAAVRWRQCRGPVRPPARVR